MVGMGYIEGEREREGQEEHVERQTGVGGSRYIYKITLLE